LEHNNYFKSDATIILTENNPLHNEIRIDN
jgi:hypothetical protein